MSRVVGLLLVVLLVTGIPANLLQTTRSLPSAFVHNGSRRVLSALPRTDLARAVPGWVQPDPQTPEITVSWLLGALRSGKLPGAPALTLQERAADTLRLSLAQSQDSSATACTPLVGPRRVTLRPGESIFVRGTILVALERGEGIVSQPLGFGASLRGGLGGHRLLDVGGPLSLRIFPFGGGRGALCRPPGS